MKLAWATALFFLCSTAATSPVSISENGPTDAVERDAALADSEFGVLEKRRGGGGGGRSGGSSGGGSGGRSSSSSSSSGSSRGGSSSGGTSSSSRGGSGVSPSYGGGRYDYYSNSNGYSAGYAYPASYPDSYSETRPARYDGRTHDTNRYYAGGSPTSYTSGMRSPLGITPFLLPAAALAFFPGVWLYSAYAYPYNHPYYYTNDSTHRNESLPVVCLCEEHQECGCDDNNNSTYYESLFNGTQPHNTSDVRVVDVNGTEKIYINGTLANSTASSTSPAPRAAVTLLNASGYWVTVAVVVAAVWVF
ncbi:uncharacterized protein N7459_006127 [Penicillium hispanicum]|uniref:uncharacterized protein n=1 Tax=Penicillium hispanicum TaxID=1080232 RepID=UPI002541E253|nr:uncharacterized protein N7459_006127 [Penicillium hispanicum]KAJ5580142.1 hypothetical protein N7459_006127 [Penicillium hispanicum]